MLSKTVFILTIIKGLFVTSLVLSLFLWSIPILSFHSGIWEIFQEKSGVVLDSDVKSYNELLIDFFKSGLGLGFLNEKEVTHMKAVRDVIRLSTIFFAFSFVFLIIGVGYFSKKQKRFLLEATKKTSLAVFAITLILSILILIDFNTAFQIFHKIVFVKNFIFPSDSLLKILYPDKFFYGLGAFYLVSILVVSLIAVIVSHKLKLK